MSAPGATIGRNGWAPYAASLVVAVIFAAHYLAARHVLQFIDPVALAASRGLVGGGILALMFWRSLARHLTARRVALLSLVAALGFCGNQLLFLAGLARTTPADAAMVSVTIPVISALLGIAFKLEPFRPRTIAGAALGLVVIMVYLARLHALALHEHALGNLLVLANVLAFCGALVLVKLFAAEIPAEVVTGTMLLVGGAGLAIAAGSKLEGVWTYTRSSPEAGAIMAFETVVTTVVGYGLNLWALKRLSLAATTVFNYLQTPLAALGAWLAFGLVPGPALGLAFLGVAAACALVVTAERQA